MQGKENFPRVCGPLLSHWLQQVSKNVLVSEAALAQEHLVSTCHADGQDCPDAGRVWQSIGGCASAGEVQNEDPAHDEGQGKLRRG